jgi:riboflavin synthase
MRETLVRSSLRDARPGLRVNLERAVQPTSRLGGHIVQGHVDGTGTLISRTRSEHWDVLRFGVPASMARYLVDKGSIAIDGVSLTVSAVDPAGQWFEVSLIPTTLALTTLGDREVDDIVNLEADVIAKYVEGLLRAGEGHA